MYKKLKRFMALAKEFFIMDFGDVLEFKPKPPESNHLKQFKQHKDKITKKPYKKDIYSAL